MLSGQTLPALFDRQQSGTDDETDPKVATPGLIDAATIEDGRQQAHRPADASPLLPRSDPSQPGCCSWSFGCPPEGPASYSGIQTRGDVSVAISQRQAGQRCAVVNREWATEPILPPPSPLPLSSHSRLLFDPEVPAPFTELGSLRLVSFLALVFSQFGPPDLASSDHGKTGRCRK